MPTCWVQELSRKPKLEHAKAILASPGLRSVGWLAINYFVEKLKPTLIAKIYSTSFPVIYETIPSYSTHPAMRGRGGVFIDSGTSSEPSVEIYLHEDSLVLVKGYQANFYGQREVAEKTIEFLREIGVKLLIGLAAHATGEEEFCLAATKPELVKEYCEVFQAKTCYVGPLLGFTGLTLGEAAICGLDGICVFAKTMANPDFPEQPDYEAAKKLANIIANFLGIKLDLSDFEKIASSKTSF
ncbi:MAG: hypothetical protein DRJ31_02700 [Candidatus Methanomethylicota archaeon]|uniref:Proteasome assembly chaperone family protein n=1 Tax=Thermoproteota archaeon TaxID=2056631 RepID=A0A497ES76_9CREN|nr:MAG: hypothetical protein DRJ31_02700 [Candidatus Verstraetearchaeota archaeon]